MECTECNSKTKVIDSRDVGDGSIRRRRECLHCHHRFKTYEILKDVLLSGVPDPPTSKRPRKNAPPYKGGPSHYVYYLIDPRDNEVFYVGKGQGNRMLEHEWNVRAGRKTENTMTERIITEILDAGALIVGASTINNNMFPSMADAMSYLKGLRPANKIGAVFGSVGWSGESIKQLTEIMTAMKVELILEPIIAKFVPTDDILQKCFQSGEKIAKSLSEKVK